MRINVEENSDICVAIYGGGEKGKAFYNRSEKAWGNRIKIVGVVDQKKDLDWIKPIDIDTAKALFKSGRIEGCIITTSNEKKGEIESVLSAAGITTLELANSLPFISAKEYGEYYSYVTDELAVYIVDDVMARVDNINGLTWCYIREGIIEDIFNYKWAKDEIISSLFLTFECPDETVEELCVLDRSYSHNYWHFIFEVLEKMLRMEKKGFKGKYLIPGSEYSRQFVALMGLESDRIIYADESTDCRTYLIKRFYCFNGYKGKEQFVADYLTEWADKLAVHLCRDTIKKYPSKLYIKRIHSRRLNDDAEKKLEKEGFSFVVAEEISVEEQIKCFHMADVIFVPHGACTANSVFMQNGKKLIESFGGKYVNPCCLNIINKKGIKYSMLVENVETDGHNSDDYYIDEELLSTVL